MGVSQVLHPDHESFQLSHKMTELMSAKKCGVCDTFELGVLFVLLTFG
jgi:hypothetical protein